MITTEIQDKLLSIGLINESDIQKLENQKALYANRFKTFAAMNLYTKEQAQEQRRNQKQFQRGVEMRIALALAFMGCVPSRIPFSTLDSIR